MGQLLSIVVLLAALLPLAHAWQDVSGRLAVEANALRSESIDEYQLRLCLGRLAAKKNLQASSSILRENHPDQSHAIDQTLAAALNELDDVFASDEPCDEWEEEFHFGLLVGHVYQEDEAQSPERPNWRYRLGPAS